MTYMTERSPHGISAPAFRPVRMGRKGAVVANHPLAAMAGMTTLQRGGNAVDAAVAVGFALGVAEPQSSGIGGDGFVMVYMNDGRRLEVANGTGAAPLAATAEFYRDGIPHDGILGSSVPGIVDALLAAHDRYGILDLMTCLEPAIELCEDGVPVTDGQVAAAKAKPILHTFPTSAAVYAPHGRPLEAGEVRRNPNLGRTYRLLAEQGRDALYRGEIAREIVRFSEEYGGLFTMKDFERHKMKWQPPVSVVYRGRSVYEAPPNSSGHVLLQQLAMFEHFDPSELTYLAPETVHVMVEAKKLAFADREAYLADPDFVDVPIEGLLAPEYAAARSRLIDPESCAQGVKEGDPWAYMDRPPDESKRYHRPGMTPVGAGMPSESDTTHFCVVDRWGNAVGELQSVQTGFGSGVIAGDTGILLNNRMTYWNLGAGHANLLHPGQRVRHTMNPVMVFSSPVEDDGELELVCGTPGADTQVQTNFQVVSAVFDHGLNVAEAIDAPRWTHYQGGMTSTWPPDDRHALAIEDRVESRLVDSLRSRGHQVDVIGAWGGAGSEGAIQVHRDSGALMAASDPRRDGQALVW